MPSANSAAFAGFPADFFAFFQDLEIHNNRAWFNANKSRYYESVVNPISAFIVGMAPRLRKISTHYVADPRIRSARSSSAWPRVCARFPRTT
jgi:uncharacterized protein (DUF2461 family)